MRRELIEQWQVVRVACINNQHSEVNIVAVGDAMSAALTRMSKALEEIREGARAQGEAWCAYKADMALSLGEKND